MSNTYKHGDIVPTEVLADRLNEFKNAVVQRMRGNPSLFESEFTCRIPAELDRDPDLVLGEAARRLSELQRESEWVSVDDRLPGDRQEVFIYSLDLEEVYVAFYCAENTRDTRWETEDHNLSLDEFSLWKPITPPKEG